ncbi:hypothetical protein BV25DRAFT_1945046 [Artomyces pyxidatus]|uniref:Uncharacterized protein n=1 Tax=Artomyces pyxidatus TaxID=48021 RepID=A0ACB8T1D9_9AGAM|nr:hypothetical protein BV25DRAFT_1945046 [Artomyces pyxidatus]
MEQPTSHGWDSRRVKVQVLYRLSLGFCLLVLITVKVYLDHLSCLPEQRQALDNLYRMQKEYRKVYSDSEADKAAGQEFCEQHGLDLVARQRLESRWGVAWSTRNGKNSGTRILLQCTCGYSTKARQDYVGKTKSTAAKSQEWRRTAPYEFTGCLAHVDITYGPDGNVRRVVGNLEHNEKCISTVMTRYPAVPLHEHVVEVALQQLADGASVGSIQSRNLQMVEQKLYRDQLTTPTLSANFRYQIQKGDFSRIYRRHHRANGIDISVPPEFNVHAWLDPNNPAYRPGIHDAVFFYTPRESQNDRFRICICTADMEQAAWTYVHGSQLILDGTFGLSSSRLLLWIAMGVDSEGHGVPVAMFLFSAPTGNRATHAGYDTAIIQELLEQWRTWMNTTKSASGRLFEPAVAITDTDTKERGALIAVWPQIQLLLCKFHVRQCWTNKRSQLLGKGNQEEPEHFSKNQARSRLQAFELSMLQTTSIQSAQSLVDIEKAYFKICVQQPESKKAGEAGLGFLAYFESTWMPEQLWASWSQLGRNRAAARLGVSVNGVLPTTNHLESFNGVLKTKYIPQWQHSKARLRFDVLIFHLIHSILPRLYAQLRLKFQSQQWKGQRFLEALGGKPLNSDQPFDAEKEEPLAWFSPDSRRDTAASDIHQNYRLIPIPSLRPYELWASCAASLEDPKNPSHRRYWLTVHISGSCTCTCLDWLQRGAACKHLRAFRDVIQMWTEAGHLASFCFPTTREEAIKISEENRAWYGPHLRAAITQPLLPSTSATASGYLESNIPSTMQQSSLPSLLPKLPPATSGQPLPSLEGEAALQTIVDSSDVDLEQQITEIEEQGDDYLSNRQAVAIQTQQRVEHSVGQILPRMHGLVTDLSETVSLKFTEDLLEFQGVLGVLQDQISRLLARGGSPEDSSPLEPTFSKRHSIRTKRRAGLLVHFRYSQEEEISC